MRCLLALVLILAAASAPVSAALAAKKKSSTPSIAAAIVVDMNSGTILHAQAADTPRHPASLTKMMTLYVLFGYLRAGKLKPNSDLTVTPARRQPGADQARPEARRHPQSQRCDQGPGHPIGQRRLRRHRREPCRHRGELRPADDRHRPANRHEEHRFPQCLRPAQRRADHHGAGYGHPRGAPHPRLPRLLQRVRDALFHLQGPQVPQPQQAAVRLQGHRRHQDRLHQGQRLQSHGLRASRQQAPRGGCARRQDRQPARRGHAHSARQEFRRGLRDQADTRATHGVARWRASAAAARPEEARLDAGASHTGPNVQVRKCRGRYRRARPAAQSEPEPRRPPRAKPSRFVTPATSTSRSAPSCPNPTPRTGSAWCSSAPSICSTATCPSPPRS